MKMKTLLIGLLLSPIMCSAQNFIQKVRVGATIATSYLKPNDGFLAEVAPVMTIPITQYGAGMSFRYTFKQRWALVSGISVTTRKFDYMPGFVEDQTHPAYTPPSDSWNCILIGQENLYAHVREWGVSIPALVQFYPIRNRFFVSSGLEFNQNVVARYRSAYKAYDGTVTTHDESLFGEGTQLFLPLSAGVQFNMPNGHRLQIEPGLQLGLFGRNTADPGYNRYALKAALYF